MEACVCVCRCIARFMERQFPNLRNARRRQLPSFALPSRNHRRGDQKGSPRRLASIAFQHIERRLLGSPALRAGLNRDAATHAAVGFFAIGELDFQPLRLHLL